MKQRLLVMALGTLVVLGMSMAAYAQEPDVILDALADLSQRAGKTLALDDLSSWQWEQKNFPDTSLGCPKPGLSYPQVITNGYQILLTYEGVTYDYRVSADRSTLFLCSPGGQATVPGTPIPTIGPGDDTTPQPRPTTPAPPPAGIAVCAGALPARLAVGAVARSTTTGSINIREMPDTGSDVAGLLLPGAQMDVIGGPECSPSRTWWQISYESRAGTVTGWVVEGDDLEYWLEPVGALPTVTPSPTPGDDRRAVITSTNADQARLFTERALRDTVEQIALLPPPSSDALIVANRRLVFYFGDTITPDVTPLGNEDFDVLDIVAARHESAAARFATLEEDPQNPGPKMLFAWELAADIPLEVTRTSGLQVPFVPNSMAFSPDGRVLAVSSGDLPEREPAGAEDMVWLWDLANGAQVTFDLDAPAADLAFSPDGSLLAVSVPSKGIYLWEVATQTQRALLPGEYGRRGTPSMAFSPDGRTLAGGAEDGTVVLWDIATATELRTLGEPADDPVLFVAYSPDGTVLAAADARLDDDLLTNGARLWEPDTGALLATLADQTEPVKALGFRSEGRELVMIGTQTWVSWAVY